MEWDEMTKSLGHSQMIRSRKDATTPTAYVELAGHQQSRTRAVCGDQDHVVNAGWGAGVQAGSFEWRAYCPQPIRPEGTFSEEGVESDAGCWRARVARMTARNKVLARQPDEAYRVDAVVPPCET